MYLILKPETRKHIGSIETAVLEEGFRIASKHPIEDWTGLARELYFHQSEKDPQFHAELECYLWLTNHIFGNYAAAFILEKRGDLTHNLQHLYKFKDKLRYKISNGSDRLLRIFLDVGKIDPTGKYVPSKQITLPAHSGKWDNYFFKYVHTPDPKLGAYEREITILKERGILDKSLADRHWEQMKYMQSLVSPDGFRSGRRSNED
ncbi:MAG: hypothetical protein KKE23_03805 [Nanoarchaeota archaeon]|nr:hypothetical protein [Nanoarchaeota archaeon]